MSLAGLSAKADLTQALLRELARHVGYQDTPISSFVMLQPAAFRCAAIPESDIPSNCVPEARHPRCTGPHKQRKHYQPKDLKTSIQVDLTPLNHEMNGKKLLTKITSTKQQDETSDNPNVVQPEFTGSQNVVGLEYQQPRQMRNSYGI